MGSPGGRSCPGGGGGVCAKATIPLKADNIANRIFFEKIFIDLGNNNSIVF